MPKYLLQASYTAEGAKGILKDGGPADERLSRNFSRVLGARWKPSISTSVRVMQWPSWTRPTTPPSRHIPWPSMRPGRSI